MILSLKYHWSYHQFLPHHPTHGMVDDLQTILMEVELHPIHTQSFPPKCLEYSRTNEHTYCDTVMIPIFMIIDLTQIG